MFMTFGFDEFTLLPGFLDMFMNLDSVSHIYFRNRSIHPLHSPNPPFLFNSRVLAHQNVQWLPLSFHGESTLFQLCYSETR